MYNLDFENTLIYLFTSFRLKPLATIEFPNCGCYLIMN